MKKNGSIRCILLIVVVSIILPIKAQATETKEVIAIPKAKKEKYEQKVNGDVLVDYYHWLRDQNWPKVKNKEILNYLKVENKYTENYFAPYQHQEAKLIKEMKGRILENEETYPKRFDDYYYYRKYSGDYFQVCRKKNSLQGSEEIILDVNKLVEQKVGYTINSIVPSPKHNMVAYSEDLNGGERYSISIKNLKTGKVDSNIVNDMWGNIIWHGSNKGFFYTKRDNRLRLTEVYYHELGKKQSADMLIYKEKCEECSIDISNTSDKKYLVINSFPSLHMDNEIRIINIEKEVVVYDINLVIERRKGQGYEVDHREEEFYIKINDKGKNFRLVKVKKVNLSNREKWIELIPHSEKEFLVGYSLSKKYLMVNARVNGANKIVVFDKRGKKKEVKFEEEAYDAYGYFTTYDSKLIRIDYSSFTTPLSVLEYDCDKNEIYNRKIKKVLGGYDKEKYQSEKIYITADDGVEIPVSLFYRKDKFKKDGKNPLLLYGYGSYGISSFANFDASLFSLVDRGFVYAIAHIRGGSEQGYKWVEEAKLLTKKRTFLDYINCAEGLIKRKYASPKKLVGYGVSAGGMLIGYVLNERPELLKIAIANVPSVDTLNQMIDKKLKNTPFHYGELGNPNTQKYYNYIKSYSPYDNIRNQEYPAIYATAGLSDPRVEYWQPAKWVAKLKEYNKGNNPILLETNMETGHYGPSGKESEIKQKAKMYNFILINLGISVD
jgi:oligopeptidase B